MKNNEQHQFIMDWHNEKIENKKMTKKVFIICIVRGASEEYVKKLETYVADLESKGVEVHLPHRDTNQTATGYEICTENMNAIAKANEVHIFYNSKSQGTHFDMGVAFAMGKRIVVVESEKYGPGKSYPRMLDEWAEKLKVTPMSKRV